MKNSGRRLSKLGALDRKFFIVGMCSRKAATAYNEHIAKIAALPRVINICVFLPLVARVDKVLGSSNFGNMPLR
jgi:hypothetical protein